MRCTWSTKRACQFSEWHDIPISEHSGRALCIFHLPNDASDKRSLHDEKWKQLLKTNDLSGVHFFQPHLELQGHKRFTDCTFSNELSLDLRDGVYFFDGACFEKKVVIRPKAHVSVNLVCADFRDSFELQCRGELGFTAKDWLVEGTHFRSRVMLGQALFTGSLSLNETVFHAPVEFEGCVLPQQTTAHGLRFVDAAINKQSEGSYRFARMMFAKHGNRDLEGLMYAAEKRAQRHGLHWASFSRFVNLSYDAISEYGQNYVRALNVLVALQVAAYVGYGLFFCRFDSPVLVFTLAQILKPFELFSIKSGTPGSVFAELFGTSPPSLGLLITTTVHSLLSLAVFALVVLALRWRFKRE